MNYLDRNLSKMYSVFTIRSLIHAVTNTHSSKAECRGLETNLEWAVNQNDQLDCGFTQTLIVTWSYPEFVLAIHHFTTVMVLTTPSGNQSTVTYVRWQAPRYRKLCLFMCILWRWCCVINSDRPSKLRQWYEGMNCD